LKSTLGSDIVLPSGINNVTCHTRDLTRGNKICRKIKF